MGHRRQAESMPSGDRLQVVLLLGSIFVSACRAAGQCPRNFGSWTARVHLTDGLNKGSVATFRCPSGQYPWPQNSRTCQGNGEWSDIESSFGKAIKFISCRKFSCPEPIKFENGRFHPRGPFFVGSNVTFTCNDGYIPRGSMVRTCTENGTWSGDTAVCDDGAGYCPDPGIPVGSIKKGVRYDVNDTVSYKCIPGLNLIGSSKRTCLQSRRRSGAEVTCHFPNTFHLLEEVGQYYEGSYAKILSDREKISDMGNTLQIKKDRILNVYILVDASDTVGKEKFETMKKSAQILVSELGAFDMTVQFGVISFATDPEIVVNIFNNEDADEVVKIIENGLNYTAHEYKSGKDAYGALEEVLWMMSLQKEIYKDPAMWNSIYHVIVLLTDGRIKMSGRPLEMLKNIKKYLNITKLFRESKTRKDLGRPREKWKALRAKSADVYAINIEDTNKTEPSSPPSEDYDRLGHPLKNAESMKPLFQHIMHMDNYGEMCGFNDESEPERLIHHPWSVKITFSYKDWCLGTLISGRWVLSAAHCFPEYTNLFLYFFFIDDNLYTAEEIFIHDCYNLSRKLDRGIPWDYDYDMALVKLTRKVIFTKTIRPICLPCTEPANRAMKMKKSAGCDEHRTFLLGSSDLPAEFLSTKKDDSDLYELGVRIKSHNLREACVSSIQDKYKNISIHDMVSPRHLCVQGHMACKREYGGSLFVNIRDRKRFFQVGVLSFGTFNPCEKPRRQTSYPRHARDFSINIMEVLPWLHKHLQGELEFQPDVNNYKEVACPP